MNAASDSAAPDSTAPASPYRLSLVTANGFDDWLATQSDATQRWLKAQQFTGAAGSHALLPGDGGMAGAVLGVGDAHDPFAYAHAPFALPVGDWRVSHGPNGADFDAETAAALQLGWGLGSYRFSRYRTPTRTPARLVVDDADADTAAALAACTRVRDLVNTPTEHLGPDELETIAREIAQTHGAEFDSVVGDDLLRHNFPAIHAVGRASHRAPRLIVLRWGRDSDPLLAVVGKGVCFDTGGLDIKAAAGMRNMKKDMGGAAHALALAEWIMSRKLPVRLLLLLPAVENAIGPNAYRPGEVIATRKGLSVEIDNTDAEGRLVLADALCLASELQPDLIMDFATLTGAARIALGPDLPVLFSNRDDLARAYLAAGEAQHDPLWRLPLWQPYLSYLKSNIADLANAGASKMAGCMTAALFLQRFVDPAIAWTHVDVYSWNDGERPGRPTGGEAQGLRAAFLLLQTKYDNRHSANA